jgi:hypothetical protein
MQNSFFLAGAPRQMEDTHRNLVLYYRSDQAASIVNGLEIEPQTVQKIKINAGQYCERREP